MAARGAPLLGRPDITRPTVQELLAATRPDLLVSWFWTKRIPMALANVAPLGAVNVHPSLLPRHRGADPYFWTVLAGDREAGITVHEVTARYDEGPVLLQRRLEVPTDCDAWRLARALDGPSLAGLREVVKAIARGERPVAVPQSAEGATEAPTPSDEDCELRWDQPVERVLALVLAAGPEPGAFTAYGDDTVVVLRAKRAERAPRGFDPGDVLRTGEGVVVVCRDGAIVVTSARRDHEHEARVGAAVGELFADAPGVE